MIKYGSANDPDYLPKAQQQAIAAIIVFSEDCNLSTQYLHTGNSAYIFAYFFVLGEVRLIKPTDTFVHDSEQYWVSLSDNSGNTPT